MSIKMDKFRKISVKTASYTIDTQVDECGTLFTNRGAAAITITLPTPGTGMEGLWYEFYSMSASAFTITGPGELVVAHNNLTADGIAFSTSSETIGNSVVFIWDGTSWLAKPSIAQDTATVTITDA